jgi:hypothetical protein
VATRRAAVGEDGAVIEPASDAALIARLRAARCVFAEDETALLIAHWPSRGLRVGHALPDDRGFTLACRCWVASGQRTVIA